MRRGDDGAVEAAENEIKYEEHSTGLHFLTAFSRVPLAACCPCVPFGG
jgi:hypothetical protein